MDREEILKVSRSENKNMDELQHLYYKIAYMTGGFAAVLIAVILSVYEILTKGNWFGYLSIIFAQLGVSGLVYGIKARKSTYGLLYLVSGFMCTFVSIINMVMFFVRELK